jgi:Flp pilus assembly protein TadG
MAFICTILFMFLFGILEYCRLLFVMHLANNAARDGARYAAVHTGGGTMPGEPTTITSTNITNVVNTGIDSSIVYGSGMCGMQQNITGYTVNVFYVDPVALAQTPAVVQAKSGTSWSDAPFGQQIAVQITGTYQPIAPSLLFLNASIPFNIIVMANSEAN